MTARKENGFDTYKQRLEEISMMLKEMRLTDGKTQNGYKDCGLTRRQIQTSESGCNMTLIKLFSLLDCYGYTLKDIDWID
jgi:hypothetical protein